MKNNITAIILAGGNANRLNNIPKGLLKINGETLINRLIKQFKQYGIKKIIIVIGVCHKNKNLIPKNNKYVNIVYNPIYLPTNSMSLHTGIKFGGLNNDIIVCSCDSIFDDSIIQRIINFNGNCYTIDRNKKLNNTDVGAVIRDKCIIGFSKSSNIGECGLFKITKENIRNFYKDLNPRYNAGYFTLKYYPVFLSILKGERWDEVDTSYDYYVATLLFESKIKQEKVKEKELLYLIKEMDFPGFHLEQRNLTREKRALKNSISYTVRYNNKLIGYARTFGDKQYLFGIADVMIHPYFQDLGLGYRLLNTIVNDLKKLHPIKIFLFSAKGKEKFYSQFGFNITKANALEIRGDENVG